MLSGGDIRMELVCTDFDFALQSDSLIQCVFEFLDLAMSTYTYTLLMSKEIYLLSFHQNFC